MVSGREIDRVEKNTLARATPDVVLEDVVECLHACTPRIFARVVEVVEDVLDLRVQAPADRVAIHAVLSPALPNDGVVDHAGDRLVLLVVGKAGPLGALHCTRGLGDGEHDAECEEKRGDAVHSHGRSIPPASTGRG